MKYYLLKDYGLARKFLENISEDYMLAVMDKARLIEVLADIDIGIVTISSISSKFYSIYGSNLDKNKIQEILNYFVQNNLVEAFEINNDILDKIRKLQLIL